MNSLAFADLPVVNRKKYIHGVIALGAKIAQISLLRTVILLVRRNGERVSSINFVTRSSESFYNVALVNNYAEQQPNHY